MCEMSRVHALNFRALCGANLVTLPSKFRGNETFEVKGVDAVERTVEKALLLSDRV